MDTVLNVLLNSRGFVVGAKKVTQASKTMRGAISASRGGLASLQNQIFSFKGALAGLGLGVVGKSFLDAANTTEQLQVRLRALLGSVEEGNRMFDDMATFASKVPFSFDEIMQSATQLAGIMEGGVDEVNQWIPMIGDLAAVSGLGIQETTEQVVRMYSAGAASADKFRERGINAMLGFQAGVSYTAEETRLRLMEEWTKTNSSFRGVTAELAKTWTGTMSMIGDKWFQFRNQIMEAGLFDFLKVGLREFDTAFGNAIEGNEEVYRGFVDTIIGGADALITPLGWLVDGVWAIRRAVQGLNIVWKGLNIAWLQGLQKMQNDAKSFAVGFNKYIAGPLSWLNKNIDFKIDIDSNFPSMEKEIKSMQSEIRIMADEMKRAVTSGLPSEDIRQKMDEIIVEFESLRQEQMLGGEEGSKAVAEVDEKTEDYIETLKAANKETTELTEKAKPLKTEYSDTYNVLSAQLDSLGDNINDAFVESIRGGDDAWKDFGNTVVNELIRMINYLLIIKPLVDSLRGYISPDIGASATTNSGSAAPAGATPVALTGAGGLARSKVALSGGGDTYQTTVNYKPEINTIDGRGMADAIAQQEPVIVGLVDKAVRKRSGRRL